MEALIGDEGKVTAKIGLKKFPFLCFKTLWVLYNGGSLSIYEKLQLLHYHLQLFETVLSDLEKVILSATINQDDQSQFRNHSQFITNLREKVLPICDSSPVYLFHIDFQSDKDAAGNFIGQILQQPPINRCQEASFFYSNETFIQLPVEVITNWLNRNYYVGIGGAGTGQNKKERILYANKQIKIQNAVEMCDWMQMVITFYFIFNIKIVKEVNKIYNARKFYKQIL